MKYVVYKGFGGLTHMLNQINRAIILSEITNRYLIIDTMSQGLMYNFSDFFYIKDFKYSTDIHILDKYSYEYIYNNIQYYANNKYKLVPSNIKLENDFNKLKEKTADIICLTWLKNTPYDTWKIQLNKNVLSKIKKYKIDKHYIGVHFRNTDIKNNIKHFITKIKHYKSVNTVYLATDDYYAYNMFKKHLTNYNIIQYTKPSKLENDVKNTHLYGENKNNIIEDALLDMYMLMNSTTFVPSINSSYSMLINKFRNNYKNNYNIHLFSE